jgi:hypothetical protein
VKACDIKKRRAAKNRPENRPEMEAQETDISHKTRYDEINPK